MKTPPRGAVRYTISYSDEETWCSVNLVRPPTIPPGPSLRERLVANGAITPVEGRHIRRPTLRLDERGHYFARQHIEAGYRRIYWRDEPLWAQDPILLEVGKGIDLRGEAA